ncbi:MAG: hypothetical protein ACE5EX_11995, partial [Phycisphaerae bacterium]
MRVWFVIISVLVCTLGAWSRPPTAALAQAPAPPPSPDRVVHRFDFDERPEGNLEETPKYWEPIRPPRFPHFAHGEFDDRIGHDAPPSFRLVTEGRNVAYEYTGPDTRIRANTDYRIEAYIRPDRLQRARACLTAHLLDQSGRPMVDTLVRSDYVGGKGSDGRWVRIDLSLSAASRDAHAIALTAWVLQEDVWSTETKPSRYIHRRDVHGAAWFDDITIYALPHVKLSTSAPGNVLAPDGPQFLDVVLADEVESSLTGRLSITAADGGL